MSAHTQPGSPAHRSPQRAEPAAADEARHHSAESVTQPNPRAPVALPADVCPNEGIQQQFEAFINALHVTTRKEPPCMRVIQLGGTHFYGSIDPSEAEIWLRKIERILDYLQCDDRQKVACTGFLFQGAAGYWWESVRRKYDDPECITWMTLKSEFEDKYLPQTYKDVKHNEFIRLVQGAMTVSQYEEKFTELSRFATDMVASETAKSRRFIRGLRENIRSVVTVGGFTEYSKAVDAALRVEQSKMDVMPIQTRWPKNTEQNRSSGFQGGRSFKKGGNFFSSPFLFSSIFFLFSLSHTHPHGKAMVRIRRRR